MASFAPTLYLFPTKSFCQARNSKMFARVNDFFVRRYSNNFAPSSELLIPLSGDSVMSRPFPLKLKGLTD